MRKTMSHTMISKAGFLSAMVAVAVLAGCASNEPKKAEEGKFRVGALQTQIAGGDPKLAATGQFVGTFIGKPMEAPLDPTDKPLYEDALRKAYAMNVGDESPWKNEKTGNSGRLISTREGWRTNGTYCREFQETVTVGKDTYQGYGASCKQADGQWKRISQSDFPGK